MSDWFQSHQVPEGLRSCHLSRNILGTRRNNCSLLHDASQIIQKCDQHKRQRLKPGPGRKPIATSEATVPNGVDHCDVLHGVFLAIRHSENGAIHETIRY